MKNDNDFAVILERAFVQYVNDQREDEDESKEDQPLALGCCRRCGFTYYQVGEELFHYAYVLGGPVEVCDSPQIGC